MYLLYDEYNWLFLEYLYMLLYFPRTYLLLNLHLYSFELNFIQYDIHYLAKLYEYLLYLDIRILVINSILIESS